MKAASTIFALLSAACIALCLLRPYGSPEFTVLWAWPIVSVSALSLFFLISRFAPDPKIAAVFAISFMLSSPFASIVSERNAVYLAVVDGTVSKRYIGGHAMKAIEVTSADGTIYTVKGITEPAWNQITEGQPATKTSGSFKLLVGDRSVDLSKDGSVR